MPNFEDYKLALTEPGTLVTSPVYELTIPLAAPASAKDPWPRRGQIKTAPLKAPALTFGDMPDGTLMVRLSRIELDLIADLILQERSKNQYG